MDNQNNHHSYYVRICNLKASKVPDSDIRLWIKFRLKAINGIMKEGDFIETQEFLVDFLSELHTLSNTTGISSTTNKQEENFYNYYIENENENESYIGTNSNETRLIQFEKHIQDSLETLHEIDRNKNPIRYIKLIYSFLDDLAMKVGKKDLKFYDLD